MERKISQQVRGYRAFEDLKQGTFLQREISY